MSIEEESDKNSIVGKHFHYLILGYATIDLYVSLFVSTVMKGDWITEKILPKKPGGKPAHAISAACFRYALFAYPFQLLRHCIAVWSIKKSAEFVSNPIQWISFLSSEMIFIAIETFNASWTRHRVFPWLWFDESDDWPFASYMRHVIIIFVNNSFPQKE